MTTSRHKTKAAEHTPPILRHNVKFDRVQYVAIDRLAGHSRRLRKRTDAGVAALKSSVASFGIVLPILIDARNVIIGGEGIVEAAKAVGYHEVPTLRIDHLDEAEVRMLRIALNKLTEQSSWDRVELAAEFGELLQLDTELAYEVTGFDTIEIDTLLHAPGDDAEDPDDLVGEIDESATAVTQLGDMWTLGEHRVICGSSLEPEIVSKLMADEKARMVLSDSPYNVRIKGHVSGLGRKQHREFGQASGEMSEEEFIDFQTRSTRTLAAACTDGALLYLWMDWRHIWEIMSGIRAAGLAMSNMAVWVKRSGAMGSMYRSQYELCFIAKKGHAPHRNNVQLGRYGRNRTNCWFYPGVNSFGAERDDLLEMHPTVKNCAMFADAIRDATHRGEIVLDGYLGSGTTLIAAERTGRVCRGVELDPLYVDTIIARWEGATGRKAVLDGTGETFAEVAARRADEVRSQSLAPPVRAAPARPEIVARARTRRA